LNFLPKNCSGSAKLVKTGTEAHKFKGAVSKEENSNLDLSSLFTDPVPAIG
jgi:hypothetical protein